MLPYPLTEKAFRRIVAELAARRAAARLGQPPAGRPRMIRAEQITDPVAYHGEGPVWSERWGGLRWVDMLAGDVLSLGADGSVERTPRRDDRRSARPAPRRRSGDRRRARLRPGGRRTARSPTSSELWSDDERPDERGWLRSRTAASTAARWPTTSAPGAGALYRLDPDGSVAVVLEDVTVSNGLDWSPDGSRAYYNDTDDLPRSTSSTTSPRPD